MEEMTEYGLGQTELPLKLIVHEGETWEMRSSK